MNKNSVKVIAFLLGTVVGSVLTWEFAKTKYEKLADEEIESVKKAFLEREKVSVARTVKREEEDAINRSAVEYAKILHNQGYSNQSIGDIVTKVHGDDPYVISPEEFGDLEDYETVSLVYYSDKFLADEMGELVDDVEEIIGWESLNCFGEYEDDAVYVRNDALKTDFEILRVLDRWADVSGTLEG